MELSASTLESTLAQLKRFANIWLTALGLCVFGIVAWYVAREWRRAPLPPGPKGRIPLMGMTFDMPKHHIVSDLLQSGTWFKGYELELVLLGAIHRLLFF